MNLNPKMFMKPEEFHKIIDLSDEYNRFIRVLERGSGEKTFLRVYEDNQKHPHEREISAAMKRLVMDLPKVGFVQGHAVILQMPTMRFCQDGWIWIIIILLIIRYSVTRC